MTNWRELAGSFKRIPYEPSSIESMLNSRELKITNTQEYSDYFKFLSVCIRTRTSETLPIVIKRIIIEWLNFKGPVSLIFRATASFLIRLKKSARREFFASEIFPLWKIIFLKSVSIVDFPKLILVREFRRELSFNWLFEYVDSENNPANFFYSVNLSEFNLDNKAQAAIDILTELLEKLRRDHLEESDECDDLRVSGVLEKIGSLWRADAMANPLYRSKILKLLALASLISGSANNIFDSLTGLLDRLSSDPPTNVWTLRLVESIMKKYPTRQYVLSQSRAEVSQLSSQVIQISARSLLSREEELDKSVCGLIKSLLERWDSLTECPAEIENEFIDNVEIFLNDSYAAAMSEKADADKEHKTSSDFKSGLLLSVFIKYFISPLKPKLALFFRNALKSGSINNLNIVTGLLVDDGGTDLAFKKLFLDHPSLVSDVHCLIDRIDAEEGNCNTAADSQWLLTLAESPRTKNVLIDFLIDPNQVTFQLQSDTLWMDFFSKLLLSVNVNNETTEQLERIVRWTQGKLVEEFYRRVFRADDCESVKVLIKSIFHLEAFRSHEQFPEILKMTKNRNNSELLFWILSNLPSVSLPIKKVLLEMVPFGNEKIAKKVYGLVSSFKDKDPGELIDEIFTVTPSVEAVDQWNLLVESGNLNYSLDEEFTELASADYSQYLEELFTQISSDSFNPPPPPIIKESHDMIEMYLEYHKYGHVKSMRIVQRELIKRFSCVELVTRIPLVILKSGGKEFGARVVDGLMVNGIGRDELGVIRAADPEMLGQLAEYYKHRLQAAQAAM